VLYSGFDALSYAGAQATRWCRLSVCLSVCLSQAGTVWKQVLIGSHVFTNS